MIGRKKHDDGAAEVRYAAACGNTEAVALDVRHGARSVVVDAERQEGPVSVTIFYLDNSLGGDSREHNEKFGSVDDLRAWFERGEGRFKKFTQAWATPVS
jgi:hypothetical protein